MTKVKISDRWVGDGEPTYFIADIAANHDGVLERAKKLIYLAKEAGADAAKFQHFRAENIVAKVGFKDLGGQQSHQTKWEKSVFEVYQDAATPWEWTVDLKKYCDDAGLHFFSSPYDFEAVDMLDPLVPAFKIGSGDITWTEMLEKVAGKGKPVILSTGASDIGEVERAVDVIRSTNSELILLQCNTNYTGSSENFKYVQLNVLKTYQAMHPDLVIGLSDHTPGHAAVLGAVALGSRVVEKHFTDDVNRDGPDHAFSMDPTTWRDMVERTRELENALGDGEKTVEENELETVVIQRRCLRAAKEIPQGTLLTRDLVEVLRPAPSDAIFPYDLNLILGRRARVSLGAGEYFTWDKLD